MKLIIAGGRDFTLGPAHLARLDVLLDRDGVTEVVSGACPTGADAGGEEWARVMDIPVRRFPADWTKHGRAAGPIRNAEMAAYADAVALFPGGRGTASMRAEAVKHGLRIFDFTALPPAS